MIEVVIFKKENLFKAVKIKGHAYSDEDDYEITCASVSTLSQTLANFLEGSSALKDDELKIKFTKTKDDTNEISIEVSDDALSRNEVQSGFLFFETGIAGLNYDGEKLVKLKYREV